MTAASQDRVEGLLADILDAVLNTQERIAALEWRLAAIDGGPPAVLAAVSDQAATQLQQPGLRPAIESIRHEQQAAVANQAKALETVAGLINATHADVLEFRGEAKAHATKIAELVAHAHAAATGQASALPEDLITDQLLERFLASHPDGVPTVNDKAIARYRHHLGQAQDGELLPLLKQQYTVSSLDDDRTLALRFQLAAVTRTEIDKRGLPTPPVLHNVNRMTGNSPRGTGEFERLARIFATRPLHEVYAEPLLVASVDAYERNETSTQPVPEFDTVLTQRLRDDRFPERAANSLEGQSGSITADVHPGLAHDAENQRLAKVLRSGDAAAITAELALAGTAAMLGLADAYFGSAAAKSGDATGAVQPLSELRHLLADEIGQGGRPELKLECKDEYMALSQKGDGLDHPMLDLRGNDNQR